MAQMINTLEKTEKIREEVKASAFSNMISLSFCCLKVFPAQILANESVLKLKRLDLSHNSLSEIPPSISILVGLKELWLQHNPLEVFPEGVCHLPKLELIDIAHTKIAELPTELAHLTKLYEMDWRFSPLADNLTKLGVDTNDILKLRKHLNNLNTRKHLELQLHEYLQGEHYIQDADKKGIKNMVHMLVMVSALQTMMVTRISYRDIVRALSFAVRMYRTYLTIWKTCGSMCAERASFYLRRLSRYSTGDAQRLSPSSCLLSSSGIQIVPDLRPMWRSR